MFVLFFLVNKQRRLLIFLLKKPMCVYLCQMSEYHIGDAMKNFLNKSNLKNGLRAVQIEEVWLQIMGKTIAKYTEKIQIVNSTLFINTHVGPLKHELLYQKDKIIQRVNEVLGEQIIKEVVIR